MFVTDLKSGVSTRLTFQNRMVSNPLWSFDGRKIAFARLSAGRGWEVYTKASDGTGPDSLLFRRPGLFSLPASWSRDGQWLVALCADTTGNYDLWRVPMNGKGTPQLYQHTPEQETGASLSPDGKWLAYTASDEGTNSLYVQSFPNPAAKYQVTVPKPVGAVWNDRGDELLVTTSDNVVLSVQVSTVGGFRQGATTRLFQIPKTEFVSDITRDGERFLIGTVKDLSSLTRFEVVLGWTQLIAREK